MGVRIGGTITGGSPLVDAQLVGFVNTSLSFQASVLPPVRSSSNPSVSYKYGVYLYYNLGYGAYAAIKFFPNWALSNRYAFNPRSSLTIYEGTGSFTKVNTANEKRSVITLEAPPIVRLPRRDPTNDWNGVKLTAADSHLRSLNGHQGHDALHGNQSSATDRASLLGKRSDSPGDTEMLDPSTPDFTQQLQCPPGDTALIRLPDFRRKSSRVPVARKTNNCLS